MKRLIMFLLVFVFLLSTAPLSAFAIKSNDAKFDQFLTEIKWEKQDYLSYLKNKGWSLNEFYTVDELGTPLTQEGVEALLTKLDMTRAELNSLMIEYGDLESGEDVLDGVYLIFMEDVEDAVEFYLDGSTSTPIDATNLQELMERFGFASEKELEAFLQEQSDSLTNYDFIEDLESSLLFYTELDGLDMDLSGLFTELGLTDEEVEKLVAHMDTLDFEDPAFEQKLTQLSDRMIAIGEFETADELTAEQIAELMDIYSDMTDLLEIRTTYFFVKDGQKTPVSLATLMTLESTNGADLLIEIYNLKDVFLADILLTAEMFGSELIVDTGKDLGTVETIITTPPAVQKPVTATPPTTNQTQKGGKLPATASDFATNTLVGLAILFIGMALFRRARATVDE
ncbi:processed acidic surface protein [Planococcus versutus]|uniref:Peptidase n=1 Tax=Planococcus versutus TaxID=1302659 RepID=A0A1B1S364_9BACL|nr:processed acidic surface protein [Planococcus versutus]ANU27647.1 peptidase [Planococcus versutus]